MFFSKLRFQGLDKSASYWVLGWVSYFILAHQSCFDKIEAFQ